MASCVSVANFVSCPLNPSHRLPAIRLSKHIHKCLKSYPHLSLEKCPFNATHYVLSHLFKAHLKECPNNDVVARSLLSEHQPLFNNQPVSETSDSDSDYSPVVTETARPDEEEEEWGENSVMDRNPRVSRYDALTASFLSSLPRKKPSGLSKTERKRWDIMEKLRVKQVQDGIPFSSEVREMFQIPEQINPDAPCLSTQRDVLPESGTRLRRAKGDPIAHPLQAMELSSAAKSTPNSERFDQVMRRQETRVLPEQPRLVTEQNQTLPEQLRALPEQHRALPEQHRALPEQPRVLPRHNGLTMAERLRKLKLERQLEQSVQQMSLEERDVEQSIGVNGGYRYEDVEGARALPTGTSEGPSEREKAMEKKVEDLEAKIQLLEREKANWQRMMSCTSLVGSRSSAIDLSEVGIGPTQTSQTFHEERPIHSSSNSSSSSSINSTSAQADTSPYDTNYNGPTGLDRQRHRFSTIDVSELGNLRSVGRGVVRAAERSDQPSGLQGAWQRRFMNNRRKE